MDKKVVIISGGSDGLGFSITKLLSSKHDVIILSPTESKLKQVSSELNCHYEVCDVSSAKQVEEVVKRLEMIYQRIDCLINNAGLWIQGELSDNSSETIERVMEVNALGPIYLSKAVIPQMKLQGSGLIINIISQAGLYGKAERSVYTASKFAVTGFTESLQQELSQFGIRVTGLYPGKLKTEMFSKMRINKDMTDALDPNEVAKIIEFILESPATILFPEIGIKHIRN